jgi:hypothetical protein
MAALTLSLSSNRKTGLLSKGARAAIFDQYSRRLYLNEVFSKRVDGSPIANDAR